MGFKHRHNELATYLGLGAELAAQTEFYVRFPLLHLEHFLTSLSGASKSLRASKSSGLISLLYGPAIPLLGIYPRHLETHVPENHGNILHNSLKWETLQISINWKMDKQNVAYLYSGMLLRNKKEQATDACMTWVSLKIIMKRCGKSQTEKTT